MLLKIKSFLNSEKGAVTVDWVVLTAAVVGLGVSVIVGIQGSSESVGAGVGDYLAASEAGQ